jgi:carboxypeptidase Q
MRSVHRSTVRIAVGLGVACLLAGCAGQAAKPMPDNGLIDLGALQSTASDRTTAAVEGARRGSDVRVFQGTPPTSPSIPVSRDQQIVAIVDGQWTEVPYIPMGDPATIERIIDEGQNRNRVMEHITYLTQSIGPRLTGSSRADQANQWTRDQFASWGLQAEMVPWGEIPVRFDRGPGSGRALLAGSNETARAFELTWAAWSSGTNGGAGGPVRGPVAKWPKDDEAWAATKDALKGAWVLLPPPGEEGMRRMGFLRQMYSDRTDARKAIAEGKDLESLPLAQRIQLAGALGFIASSSDELVRTNGKPGWREMDPNTLPTDVDVTVRKSDYQFMVDGLEKGEKIEAEFDLMNSFTPGPIPVYNTVAQIEGTTWPDEIVVVCGHLDSWDGPGSQGTLDNGTGSAVTLEAARILATVGARPKRTIKFILWTGEEQGLLGARAFVKANRDKMPKYIACLNDDGGTNYQGGLKGVRSQRDQLANATAPVTAAFPTMPVNVQVLDSFPRFASSDHFAFVEAGVPGFFWDEVGRSDYAFGWHTQNDKVNLAIPEYLVQSSTSAAITAYNLACSDEPLPREPTVVNSESERRQATQSR